MTFTIHALGPPHRILDMDATALRLRVLTDGEYFQFFRAIADGLSLATLQPQAGPDFWTAFAQLAADEIEAQVSAGLVPLPDPTMAIDVRPDVHAAQRLSRGGGSGRPALPRDDQTTGLVIRTF